MSATTAEAEGAAPARMVRTLARRWPTALAVAMTVATAGGDVDGQVAGLGEALPFLSMLYVVTARTRRPRLAWPLLGAGFALIVGLRVLDLVPVAAVAVLLGVALLVWSATGGHAHRQDVRTQALGLVGFTALAVTGLAIDPEIGLYVVAAGWLLHGVWDFVHLKLDRVVVRSYAEWCGVIDVLVAVQLVLLAVTSP